MSDARAFDMLIAIWSFCEPADREAFVSYLAICGHTNSLGMASVGMGHSADGANAGEGHVDRSASRASSAVQLGATNSPERANQLDGDAFVAVKGKARLANADSVEPSLSNAHSPATVQTRQADKAEAVTPPAVSAAPFNNPRCQHADTCHFAKERDCCHDCLMAWSKRPKDEQVRLWAEANEAARAAV